MEDFKHNLMYDVIQHNTFLSQNSGLEIRSYDKKTFVQIEGVDNLFDISLISNTDFPKAIDLIKANINVFQLPKFNSSGRTLIQNRGEGNGDDRFFSCIHDLIEILGLKGQVIFTNSALNGERLYESYLGKYNLEKKFKFVACRDAHGNPGVVIDGVEIYKHWPEIIFRGDLSHKKLFCNFNFKARIHRSGMVAILHYYDLIENNHVTTPVQHLHEEIPEIEWEIFIKQSDEFLFNLDNKDLILNKLVAFRKKYPLRIDNRVELINSAFGKALVDPLIYHVRRDSLLELISETNVSGPHFFTEKTFMAISLCKPFIMINSYKSLKALHEFGYSTFHPFIDESYDDIVDSAERCIAISKELVRLRTLRKQDPDTFYKNYNKLSEIARSNKKVFLSKSRGEILTDLYT